MKIFFLDGMSQGGELRRNGSLTHPSPKGGGHSEPLVTSSPVIEQTILSCTSWYQ